MDLPVDRIDGNRFDKWIAILASTGIVIHLVVRFLSHEQSTDVRLTTANIPLFIVLGLGGLPLIVKLAWKLVQGEFGADLLAGMSIVTSVLLEEYLAGALVVLMLSGGGALESFAVSRASSVLKGLARRTPTRAHLKSGDDLHEMDIEQVKIGDTLVIFPHEICPVDGTVQQGDGWMDESFLTGEPYRMPKSIGSTVLSGALNGQSALTIRADTLFVDSRYAQIMQVMQTANQNRIPMRRLADSLGFFYTPLSVVIAAIAWWITGDVRRFLAVLVVATPCPLLIAIPVAIIGAISLSARRGIVIRNPSVLEQLGKCQIAIFDKTGTLTYGRPVLTEVISGSTLTENEALSILASIERYSKHPLASAITAVAEGRHLPWLKVSAVRELPGAGLTGSVEGHQVRITSRNKLNPDIAIDQVVLSKLPSQNAGMECIAVIDDQFPLICRFRDQPRKEGVQFVSHLSARHHFQRVVITSGDRESEVRYLAEQVGVNELYFGQTPEQKVELVHEVTKTAPTLFVGDGINDAPALKSATVGIALGASADITSDAADAVVLDRSLSKVDELLHIGQRLRRIALQSAVGGMIVSFAGMLLASMGFLPPVAGALLQEAIDLIAVSNSLRTAIAPKQLTDFDQALN